MYDFNKGKEIANRFRGSEAKTTVLCDGDVYMIKYPDPVRSKNNDLKYMNNQFSEYIGCGIFKICGFITQDAVLGYFTSANGNNKLVVGCKDFTQDGSMLHEFSMLKNQMQDESKMSLSIESVTKVILTNPIITKKSEAIEGFWNMFIIDCLIGNKDRHGDNWGFLEREGVVEFAPIYDCGSSLSALASDEKMEELLLSMGVFKSYEYNCHSCYYMDGKRIYYHEIFKTPPAALQGAIERVAPNIDIDRINAFIDDTPCLPDIRKEYLKKAIGIRYDEIIWPAYKKCGQ
ncbi:MAG: HipA domain-containing protein [Lachnospiraceae bacterium]|jgi:hypothetical protein|nr:HipA domain-containing protein [Lachnospiraceae bacterium]